MQCNHSLIPSWLNTHNLATHVQRGVITLDWSYTPAFPTHTYMQWNNYTGEGWKSCFQVGTPWCSRHPRIEGYQTNWFPPPPISNLSACKWCYRSYPYIVCLSCRKPVTTFVGGTRQRPSESNCAGSDLCTKELYYSFMHFSQEDVIHWLLKWNWFQTLAFLIK